MKTQLLLESFENTVNNANNNKTNRINIKENLTESLKYVFKHLKSIHFI